MAHGDLCYYDGGYDGYEMYHGIDHHLGIHRDGCPVRVVGRPVRDHVLYPVRLYRYRIGIGGHADTIGRYGFDRRDHVDGYRG